MDNNTYYTCKCIYFDTGYSACQICAQWVKDTSNVEPKVGPVIFAKRWVGNLDNNNNQKNSWLVINVVVEILSSF